MLPWIKELFFLKTYKTSHFTPWPEWYAKDFASDHSAQELEARRDAF